jgi:hypothetical protein
LGGQFFELEELLWPAMAVREISRRGLRPAEFAVNQALWDWTRRAGELAVAAEGGSDAVRWCWRGRLGQSL